MDYKDLLQTHFNLEITELSLLDSHFGTEIYLAKTKHEKLFVKKLPSYMTQASNEKAVTDFLAGKGMKVPTLFTTNQNKSVLQLDDCLMTVQTFIEGKTLPLNTASHDFLKASAELLGKINFFLKDYPNLPLRFGKDFFDRAAAAQKCKGYQDELKKLADCRDERTKNDWANQIKHLNRISAFDINTAKLTYANSHGDYNISQIVVSGDALTVVDWSSACRMPVCLEVITSYVFASPQSVNGSINPAELNEYIDSYSKYFPLNDYDIKMMPYVLYFWHTMCNYTPGGKIAENYQPLATLINRLLDWLYENVETLSAALQR